MFSLGNCIIYIFVFLVIFNVSESFQITSIIPTIAKYTSENEGVQEDRLRFISATMMIILGFLLVPYFLKN